jgi:hypothetical protein
MIGNIRAFNDEIFRQKRAELGHAPIPNAISATAWQRMLDGNGSERPLVPYVGRERIKGFKPLLDENGEPVELFVDSSGFGQVGEPALTQDQFAEHALALTQQHGTLAWGVVTVGQFQAFVRAWKVRA